MPRGYIWTVHALAWLALLAIVLNRYKSFNAAAVKARIGAIQAERAQLLSDCGSPLDTLLDLRDRPEDPLQTDSLFADRLDVASRRGLAAAWLRADDAAGASLICVKASETLGDRRQELETSALLRGRTSIPGIDQQIVLLHAMAEFYHRKSLALITFRRWESNLREVGVERSTERSAAQYQDAAGLEKLLSEERYPPPFAAASNHAKLTGDLLIAARDLESSSQFLKRQSAAVTADSVPLTAFLNGAGRTSESGLDLSMRLAEAARRCETAFESRMPRTAEDKFVPVWVSYPGPPGEPLAARDRWRMHQPWEYLEGLIEAACTP
jgi:hypothetical protein